MKPTAAPPTPTTAPKPPAAALPTVESERPSGSASFLTPVDLDLELAQPITTTDELRKLVKGLQDLNGVASVRSDGTHVSLRYDSGMLLPARIRDRLEELGHSAKGGTEVQSPGDTSD